MEVGGALPRRPQTGSRASSGQPQGSRCAKIDKELKMKGRPYFVLLTALMLLVCYGSVIHGMIQQWTNDEDMAHGFAVPVVILWILWRERGRWRRLEVQPSWWGCALLALAAALDFAGALGVGLFARSLALLLSIAGAMLCLGGMAWLRVCAFPFVLALFMLPKLAIVYNQITLPLQLLATRLAASILTIAGFTVGRQGNILNVAGHSIAVVEACDGIRYLIPLGFTALVLAYLTSSKIWMRVVLFTAAVPLAIIANGIRVAAVAPIPALLTEPLHALTGWALFLLCLAALMFVRRGILAAYGRYHA